ncbi:MAG: hypothetical protein JWR35_373 [Marmoricola sp.]|nr:hypothetical protein [Marmoricola sp.]
MIARDGYDALSVDAIARKAGVTRPVVYGVYDGLGPLLFALLDRQEKRALAQLEAAIAGGDELLTDPDEFLVQAALRMMATIKADPLTWRPILLAPQSTPEVVRGRMERDRDRVRREIAKLLEVGLALRGGPELDVEIVAHALVAVLEHFGQLMLEDPPRFEDDRVVATLRALLAGLRP